ncbi:hypothetical protein RUND412_000555 [Rhizina undulata]
MPQTLVPRPSPTPVRQPPPHLPLEKLIQDHIPTVTRLLHSLLTLLTAPPSLTERPRASLQAFERDLRSLCSCAQEGVRRMDLELRSVEDTWDSVDRGRWEVCRRDYKVVMRLVQEVWEAGQSRMEELKVCGVRVGSGGTVRRR